MLRYNVQLYFLPRLRSKLSSPVGVEASSLLLVSCNLLDSDYSFGTLACFSFSSLCILSKPLVTKRKVRVGIRVCKGDEAIRE